MSEIKEYCDTLAESILDQMWDFSLKIHAKPELAFHEHYAKKEQVALLEEEGFKIDQDITELDTAFVAKCGSGSPKIGIISEYDALPNLGHGCGHNLICASAVGTAIVLKKVLEKYHLDGTVYLFGTPAEEDGGGKIIMLKNHYFDDIDSVIFMHPTSDLTRLAGACLSSKQITIKYEGKSAHAGSHPDDGVNALSASNLFCVGTGLLRQHFKSDARFSCIITNGGQETGLIPCESEIKCSLACFNFSYLEELERRIVACAKGCGDALGCKTHVEVKDGYQGRVPNTILSEVCRKELEAIGEPLLDGMPIDYGGEDLGNVSRHIPICNPYVTIFPDYKISNHTEQFRELACSDAGKRCILVTMKSLSRTVVQLLSDPSIIDEAKQELKTRIDDELKAVTSK